MVVRIVKSAEVVDFCDGFFTVANFFDFSKFVMGTNGAIWNVLNKVVVYTRAIEHRSPKVRVCASLIPSSFALHRSVVLG